ncbi:MAG TPA: GNAT family N-acetyltransferase [Rhizobiales bacterium]|nr:GNAT family N-acetyltransferase [Hyphomicrobiales bacterium]
MEIVVRRALTEEAAPLTDLIMRSKRSNGYDEAFMAACFDELSVSAGQLAEQAYWVADCGGNLCGCACLVEDDIRQTGEVRAFFIDPDWQGKGIGRLLWGKLLELATAKSLTELHLDSDPFAVPFYQAMGLKIAGETPSGSIPGRVLPYMTIRL